MIATDNRLDIFEKLSERFSIIPLNGKKSAEYWKQFQNQKREFKREDFENKNAGIICGNINGLIVLDVDQPDIFHYLCIKNRWNLPETFTVKSGGGREHYYYQYPDDGEEYRLKSYLAQNPNDGSKVHVFDVLAEGSYAVAPSSIHPVTGNSYEVEYDRPIAPAPKWLLDYCRKEKVSNNHTTIEINLDISIADIPDDIIELVKNGQEKGFRSEAIWHVLIRLVSEGFSNQTIINIFENEAIGAKYREKGYSKHRWLQNQIDKARKYVNTNHNKVNRK